MAITDLQTQFRLNGVFNDIYVSRSANDTNALEPPEATVPVSVIDSTPRVLLASFQI